MKIKNQIAPRKFVFLYFLLLATAANANAEEYRFACQEAENETSISRAKATLTGTFEQNVLPCTLMGECRYREITSIKDVNLSLPLESGSFETHESLGPLAPDTSWGNPVGLYQKMRVFLNPSYPAGYGVWAFVPWAQYRQFKLENSFYKLYLPRVPKYQFFQAKVDLRLDGDGSAIFNCEIETVGYPFASLPVQPVGY